MNFGKLEEVCLSLSHTNCVCSAGERVPDNGAFSGGACPAPAVRREGKATGATGLRADGQDGTTDGVRQPEIPLRANSLCRPPLSMLLVLPQQLLLTAAAPPWLPFSRTVPGCSRLEPEPKQARGSERGVRVQAC
jgi:hypothetical protein